MALGMAATHLLFTFFIYLSDQTLLSRTLALKAAGYLVIPNAHILPDLSRIWPAFCGALFFTLTTGAGLSLLAFLAAWIHGRMFGWHRFFSWILTLVWAGLILAVNIAGWNPPATSAFLLVPPLVYFPSRKFFPQAENRGERHIWIIHIAVILIVGIAWIPRLDENVFINVRDYILLENPAGKAVNTFYYRYTLYPAELFKTLDQKLLKTVCIRASDPETISKLREKLAVYDYLFLTGKAPCDLEVTQNGRELNLSDGHGTSVRMETAAFLSGAKNSLQDFSKKADRNRFFRTFTFLSLVIAFPLSLYVFANAICGFFLWPIPRPFLRTVFASLICMGIGLGAVFQMYGGSADELPVPEIREKLSVPDWRMQRDGLKAAGDQGIDPMQLAVEFSKLQSDHVPVRYWMARALGNSRNPEAHRMLLKLLDDPHPNVACMAYYGLGRSGFPETADEILKRLNDIPHWYIQWYAYNSLKKLGWTQQQLNTASSR